MPADRLDWDPDLLRELRNAPRLFEAIARRGADSDLKLQQRLRGEFPAELVRAAMTLDKLRTRAAAKFSRPATMWFDRVGLEQATAEAVARHKAERFHGNQGGKRKTLWRAGGRKPPEDSGRSRSRLAMSDVADLCCGIGADAVALAEHADVVAVDLDPARCLMTDWNAEAYGVEQRVRTTCMDATTVRNLPPLVHIDPDRRRGRAGSVSDRSLRSLTLPARRGRRSLRVEDCVPGVEFLRELPGRCEGGAIKLSPASNFAGHFEEVEYELVSLDGECKECTVWFGSLAEPGLWRATVLPPVRTQGFPESPGSDAGETLAGRPMDALAETGPLQRFLYDPDPAIVRAGLVDMLAEQFGLFRLDAEEEYLTGDAFVDSPFVSCFEVEAELANNPREIRRHFRTAGFGQVEIKCRRIPVRAEDVRRRLVLNGARPGVLIFARIGGKARAVVAERR
jgi:THUMP domain-like/RNA cap guanine-N2 methyltransferase